jgi:8-oxo-dGTP diphosphatase
MTKTYEQPIVSIDVVPVRFDGTEIKVAFGRRIFEPFIGQLALPGVLLLPTESIDDAAYRALDSKTGIKRSEVVTLVRLGAFDNPDRDPRGATISIALAAVITADADSELSNWQSEREFEELPFDHATIIEEAFSELNVRLWRNKEVTKALVGAEFSTAHAIKLTETLSTGAVDKTNFTRTLKNYPYVEKIGAVKTGRGRPSAGWKFIS